MDYSIVIPVFNREDLTRRCLELLPATVANAGVGEVIVVDNGSGPATAAVLAEFPYVRIIRNDVNRGFAAACNQGTRAASGRVVVHLNNDTEPLAGWLERMLAVLDDPAVGAVGAKLLFPDGTLQHAGVSLTSIRFGPEGFGPYHTHWKSPATVRGACEQLDFEVVTGACLVTPRSLFLELGGFDETYWNGYEDVDYCFKVRARGLRVVYEPSAVLYHLESQSGIQRKRRLSHNIRELSARWHAGVVPDDNRHAAAYGFIKREVTGAGMRTVVGVRLPPARIVVHGAAPADPASFVRALRDGGYPTAGIVWAAAGPVPAGIPRAADPLAATAAETEIRGDRYACFVDTAAELRPGWLSDLVDTVEFGAEVCAATVAPRGEPLPASSPLAAAAGCTLLALGRFPQHLRIDATAADVHAAVADLTGRAVAAGRAIRIARRCRAAVAPLPAPLAARCRADAERLEHMQAPPSTPFFASIVMLSWNAPEYTELAVRSIREHTVAPHEIIIIDNGSAPDTVERIARIPGIRLIRNARNTGFAHGCNQGIAAASGTHVVILNNDVVVTPNWLEALLDAHRRNPLVGISAPRSNRIVGHQQLEDASYADLAEMQRYAARRVEAFRGRSYSAERLIGFCMCISRTLIDQIGGFDERFGLGNFEDDDYSIRTRAAGYEMVVREDSFIHHFGSVSFSANKVDYAAQMQKNWSLFAQRWGLPAAYPATGYDTLPLIARGFDRRTDYCALPAAAAALPLDPPAEPAESPSDGVDRLFVLALDGEPAWGRGAPVIANFARGVRAGDGARLALAVGGTLDAATVADRVERLLTKRGIDAASCGEIWIDDVDDATVWRARLDSAVCVTLDEDAPAGWARLADRSPSGFARFLRMRAAS